MSKNLRRLKNILSAIDDIDFIINSKTYKTTKSIEDKIIKPAIRMNIIRISEEFKKLKEQDESEILKNFTVQDLKGINSLRNYIAHDYDSTDDLIIEDVVRYNLPKFKKIINKIIKKI